MSHSFKLSGISHSQFEPLFLLSDDELKAHDAIRCFATEDHGYPCRVSLEDAHTGDELLLLSYNHQDAASPYRASGPIFVRRGAIQRELDKDEITEYVSSRVMSVRAYDAAHMMVDANVCDGQEVAQEIQKYFGNHEIAYIHLHNAKRGCFSCRVDRA